MNDFSYLVFKTVFMTLKNMMHRSRLKGDKDKKKPAHVCKQSFRYWQSDHESHFCNLYKPVDLDTTKIPLIIDIHGGCWVYGDKDVYDNFNYDLVEKGNNVTSLTYRTIDEVYLKDQIQDIFAYLHFLEEHHEELEISLDKVMLTGDSAGGQLSLIVYCINQSPQLQEVFDVKPVDINIQCMALTHPVCFIDKAATLPNSPMLSKTCAIPGLQRMMYGKKYEEKQEYHYSVNPYHYIQKDMKFPPILLISSQGDEMFKKQTFMLAEVFDQFKIPYEIYFEPHKEAEHVFNVNRPFTRLAKKCNRFLVNFFHKAVGHTTPRQTSRVAKAEA